MLHPEDGEFPGLHHCDVIILQIQDLVGVLNDGAVGRDQRVDMLDLVTLTFVLVHWGFEVFSLSFSGLVSFLEPHVTREGG